ncbi:hypothetical protein CY35_09G079000 [Sphagnum magellanicum]|nr:hypothetical protein CY35_09G079000 [Sphagnum magellanicum]
MIFDCWICLSTSVCVSWGALGTVCWGNMDMAFFQKSTDQQMNFPAIAGTGPTNLHTHQFYDGRRIGHWIFLLLSGSSIIFLGRKNGNTFPLGSSSMANHGG